MSSFIKTFLVFALLLPLSCGNDDASSGSTDPLNGYWNLLNVSGGFAGVDVDYDHGSVSWQFDTGTSMLRVENVSIPNGPQSTFLPIPSGEYAYSIIEADGNKFLTIDGMPLYDNGEYGRIDITEAGDLIIDQGQSSTSNAADVYVLSFKR